MNFFGEDLGETLGILLTIYGPMLAGLAALALLAVAANKKPPRAVRILCGAAGAVLLLADVVLALRALLG